jgi:hypothetical protein
MKRLVLTFGTIVLVAALAGCSASSGSSSLPASKGSGTSSAVGPALGSPQTDSLKNAPVPSRAVVTTGTIDVTVKDPSVVADRAARIVEAAGGRVDGRVQHAAQKGDRASAPDHGNATLTLRIPSAVLDATVSRLTALGKLENVSISSADVTATSKDLDARITALRTSVDRLVALMARATTTADLITIESALADRQASLESLETQQRSLADQVDLATITLSLGSVADRPVAVPANFLSGLLLGWDALVGFLGGALVVIGVVLPWMLLAAIITALVLLAIRFRRRMRPKVVASGPTS